MKWTLGRRDCLAFVHFITCLVLFLHSYYAAVTLIPWFHLYSIDGMRCGHCLQVLRDGAEAAGEVAEQTLEWTKEAMGIPSSKTIL